MLKDLIVMGAGNPDIIRLIEDINSEKKQFNFIGFTDKRVDLIGKDFWGYPIIGNDNIFDDNKYNNVFLINNTYSSQNVREITNDKLIRFKDRLCNLVHPTVRIGKSKIGVGNIIADGVVIQNGVSIDDNNIIHSNTIISHETYIGSNCLFSVNVTIGSRSRIGNFCYFGISSTTIPELTIADFSYIGGGAVLFFNLNKGCKVFGNPARILPTNK